MNAAQCSKVPLTVNGVTHSVRPTLITRERLVEMVGMGKLNPDDVLVTVTKAEWAVAPQALKPAEQIAIFVGGFIVAVTHVPA